MLGQQHVVATGGGPGAMEAANLGCFLASKSR
jgi:predicted Rossmann-fold nucleotide-binding protein